MKYNDKYDLYLDDDYVIYYWNQRLDKLMQCKIYKTNKGYLLVNTKIGIKGIHRVIYETFIGEIPDGYEIDHINAIRDDNRLDNLRIVTHKENCNNPVTLKNISKAKKGNEYGKRNLGKPRSEFGRKFKQHYGITRYQNTKLYYKERSWYLNHGKCRWE